MKRIKQWFNRNNATILKSIYSLPIIFAIVISIFHCITWFNISNPDIFAVGLSIGVEIAAATTLIAMLCGRMKFSMVLTFIIVTFYQLLGNIFFSFNYIDESGILFVTWQKFVNIMMDEPWSIDTHRFILSILSGSVIPLLSLLSLHMIATFEMKNKRVKEEKPESKIEVNQKEEEIVVEETPEQEPVVEKKVEIVPIPKISSKKKSTPPKVILGEISKPIEISLSEDSKVIEEPKVIIEEPKVVLEPVVVQPKEEPKPVEKPVEKVKRVKDPKVVIGNPIVEVVEKPETVKPAVEISRKPAVIKDSTTSLSRDPSNFYSDMGKPRRQVVEEQKIDDSRRRFKQNKS